MGWLKDLLLGNVGQQLDVGARDARIDELRTRQRCTDQIQDEQIAKLDREMQDLRKRFVTLLRILQQAEVLSASDISTLVSDLRPKRERKGDQESG
jgi:hypothetical protein